MPKNPVAKFMNVVNRPSTHKDQNKTSQEPIEESEGCYICGNPNTLKDSILEICKECKNVDRQR